MCVYDEHPLAGPDLQYQAPDSRSSNNQLITCVLLPKEYYNTLGILLTISWEYYLQYPGNTTYNRRSNLLILQMSI